MKLISIFRPIAKRTKLTTSSWLRFFSITALILIFSKPTDNALSIPERTFYSFPVRVIFLNFFVSKESRLILIRFTPAFFSGSAKVTN